MVNKNISEEGNFKNNFTEILVLLLLLFFF